MQPFRIADIVTVKVFDPIRREMYTVTGNVVWCRKDSYRKWVVCISYVDNAGFAQKVLRCPADVIPSIK